MSVAQLQPGERLPDFLRRYEATELLRFLTCGSVDDGKSTLIGRLLHDTGRIYDCLLYTSPSPRDRQKSRMPSSA